jgi:hypothetical protein
MARYAILNTVDWEGCRSLASGAISDDQVMRNLTGCAWLFRVEDGVQSVEEAAREVVLNFVASEEGSALLHREGVSRPTWSDVVPWIPDEQWARVGLEPVCHPDVERVILDASEELPTVRRAGGSG